MFISEKRKRSPANQERHARHRLHQFAARHGSRQQVTPSLPVARVHKTGLHSAPLIRSLLIPAAMRSVPAARFNNTRVGCKGALKVSNG